MFLGLSFVTAILAALFAAIYPLFGISNQARDRYSRVANRSFVPAIIAAILAFIATMVYFVFGLPVFDHLVHYFTLGLIAAISAFLPSFVYSWATDESETGGYAITTVIILAALIANSVATPFLFFQPGFCDQVGTQKMVSLLKIKDGEGDIHPTDLSSIIRVSPENALLKARRSLPSGANLGSYLEFNRAYLQEVAGHYYYVVDLKVKDWRAYETNGAVIPGFILVDAMNNEAEAEFRAGYSIKYSPNMDELKFLNDQDLDRYVYFNFILNNPGFRVMDLDGMELDDSLTPYYTGTVLKTVVGWQGKDVAGVITVNAQTGEIQYYELGNIPEWVDRVYPLEWGYTMLNNWWGPYAYYQVCQFQGKSNQREVDAANDVITSNGLEFQYTMTSPNSDQSITEIIYMDPRTGDLTKYPASGSTVIGVDNLIDEASRKLTAEGYEPVECELQFILGRKVWYCILNGRGAGDNTSSGSHNGFAFVQDTNTEEGTKVIIEATLEEAYRQLQRQIATEGGDVTDIANSTNVMQFVGVITHKGLPAGDNQPYVIIVQLDGTTTQVVFAVPTTSWNASVAQVGDSVTVTAYVEDGSSYFTATHFMINGLVDLDK